MKSYPHNFEIYRFKAGAFFVTQCNSRLDRIPFIARAILTSDHGFPKPNFLTITDGWKKNSADIQLSRIIAINKKYG